MVENFSSIIYPGTDLMANAQRLIDFGAPIERACQIAFRYNGDLVVQQCIQIFGG